MIAEIIDFMTTRPEWLVVLLAIVQFIRRFFRMPA